MHAQADDDGVEDRNDWPTDVNVHPAERKVSRVVGVGLLAFAGLRRGLIGASAGLLGAALLHRGTTGHCHAYAALKVSTAHGKRGPAASVPHGQGVRIRRAVVVPQSAAQVYKFWRTLTNLPIILHGVEEVIEMPDGRSHWRARGPLGVAVEWEATIINDVDGELIAWRSLAGSQFNHAGSVRFAPAVGGVGTVVTWTMEYDPPVGLIGTFVARMLGADPARAVDDGLRRLKLMLAAAEVAGKQPEEPLDEAGESLTGRDVH